MCQKLEKQKSFKLVPAENSPHVQKCEKNLIGLICKQ